MTFQKQIILKDGRTCILRNGTAQDAEAVLADFLLTHSETDYLTSYPDETAFTVEEEMDFLQKKQESPDEVELLAIVDGKVVGAAGITRLGKYGKLKHRAHFGISIEKAYWRLGIGRALTESCIQCARNAGYIQLELEAVAENTAALNLYQHAGFVEYGRNPLGFRSRLSGWQELVLMRLEV